MSWHIATTILIWIWEWAIVLSHKPPPAGNPVTRYFWKQKKSITDFRKQKLLYRLYKAFILQNLGLSYAGAFHKNTQAWPPVVILIGFIWNQNFNIKDWKISLVTHWNQVLGGPSCNRINKGLWNKKTHYPSVMASFWF